MRQSTDPLTSVTLDERDAYDLISARPGRIVLRDALVVGPSRIWQIVGRRETARPPWQDEPIDANTCSYTLRAWNPLDSFSPCLTIPPYSVA